MQRGNDDVGGFSFAQLQDDLRQIGLVDVDARSLKKGIQLNLRRGHGLDLDDLGGVFLSEQIEDNLASFSGVGGPVDVASGSGAASFELFEVNAEVFERMDADGRGCRAQLLPIGFFDDQLSALGLDNVDGMAHVLAQLRIAQHDQGGLRKGRSEARVKADAFGAGVGHCAASVRLSSLSASVLARICAR